MRFSTGYFFRILVLFLEVFITVCVSTCCSSQLDKSGLILESKGMRAIFQKKGPKRVKYWKISAKMCKMWKYFEKGQPHACDYRTHKTARICPGKGFWHNSFHPPLFVGSMKTRSGGKTLAWKGWAEGICVCGGGGDFLRGGAVSGDFQHGCDKMHA